MTGSFRHFVAVALIAFLSAAMPARAEGIKVVASIAPVHSLLAGVMAGVGEPDLLMTGGNSPHNYVMKPSKARMLHRAYVVVWIGPGLEGFLTKPLAGLSPKARVITLVPEPDADPHIWLDPRNAAEMVRGMARVLGEADTDNATRYRANADKVLAELITLERELRQTLKPAAVVPYLVYHDAYKFFEKRFQLAARGAVSLQAERPPGAKRVSQLRRMIVDENIVCLFTEPEFTPALLNTLMEGTPMRTGILDPLGAGLKPGPGLYGDLMRGMASAMLACLGANG